MIRLGFLGGLVGAAVGMMVGISSGGLVGVLIGTIVGMLAWILNGVFVGNLDVDDSVGCSSSSVGEAKTAIAVSVSAIFTSSGISVGRGVV